MTIQKRTTKEILEQNRARSIPPLLQRTSIWLHDIRSLYNVGSAFRSADAFGIDKIHLSGYTPHPPRPEISKTALGAEEYVTWTAHEQSVQAIKECKQKGEYVVAIEQTWQSHPLDRFMPPQNNNVCLIFGSEVTGLDEELLQLSDECIEIPQFGQKHSLNVSVSIGVVLYHVYLKSLSQSG